MTEKRRQSRNRKRQDVGGFRKQVRTTGKRVMTATSTKVTALKGHLSDYFKQRKENRSDDSGSPMRRALDGAAKGAKKVGKKAEGGYRRFASTSHKGRRLHH